MNDVALSQDTKVTIGSAVSVIAAVVGVAIWLNSWMVTIDSRMSAIENRASETYTLSQAAEDAARQALKNPGHFVPDPRRPGHFLVSQEQVRQER